MGRINSSLQTKTKSKSERFGWKTSEESKISLREVVGKGEKVEVDQVKARYYSQYSLLIP